ncbi:MAG TPA: diguanylate cyclase [Rhodocyclaceae bacterium]|jgi:diguanylate cyclase (GGDEF)-like protein|nr:diguanylate cyclase [Rhodocyclaceae bacterium]HMW77790.1 diguanylate cyclase [Rhodocyclaceae bacterium]HNE42567.1 diguanylate cyclase [Rhodocyclaceae bacterium]HNL21982.1 diguanylate cyclase [Rhodocyclaceae bacterium]HNM21821.1 diguanylate cyclase [Rhodocyclaceae bacterium]
MPTVSNALIAVAEAVERRWQGYLARGVIDAFVEFTLSLNGLTEHLARQQMPGLVRASQELENTALSLFGAGVNHPLSVERSGVIARQLGAILRELRRHELPAVASRRGADGGAAVEGAWSRPRQILIVSSRDHPWRASLAEQLEFFGFVPCGMQWEESQTELNIPLAVVFIPDAEGSYEAEAVATIRLLRSEFPASSFYCLSVSAELQSIIDLQRAGADFCIPVGEKLNDLVSRILDLVQAREQQVPRVLVVEDSATAIAHIRRSLSQHGIDSEAIGDPRALLEATARYRPDLVLMDMYMPYCTGVEVTRALRQLREYQSLPVVYLSSETDIVQQVEALRLGGDQFLTKPVNPVVLAAVVKTKIERYREMLHSGRHDSLTGLLNHSAAKAKLDDFFRVAGGGPLTAAMIDIDRFKSINDTYGHPVGDQVIRSLAWLLRGRLRSSDLIGRYGGEEFIVALPGTDGGRAKELLDRIREDFADLPHAHGAGTLRATFSCGLASVPGFRDPEALIAAADEALLVAKRSGRNMVISAVSRPVATASP